MATYTGTADASGNFNIGFGGNSYAGAQKVTVTSAKDGGSKTVELFAPSYLTGGGVIRFSGNMTNFPNNIGDITLSSEISGTIQAAAFQGTSTNMFTKATGLKIEGAVTVISSYAFYGWSASTKAILPASVTSIESSAFSGWTALTSFTIPASTTSIGQTAFDSCPNLGFLTMNSSISTIGDYAFRQSKISGSLIFPTSITSIGVASFFMCKLTSVNIPKGAIKSSAFAGNLLTSLVLGANVTSIGSNAFDGNANLVDVQCLATTPPTASTTIFGTANASLVIKVPNASLAAYQAASGWSTYASKMVGV